MPHMTRRVPVPSAGNDNLLPFPDPWSDRQDAMPEAMAESLTYDIGFALGVAAGAGDNCALRPFLLDAGVLARRHSVTIAARLMGVAGPGFRGFLAGARDHHVFQA